MTDADFRGRTMLVVFGFTFCPDVCPSALQVISAALDKLGPKAERFVPILITVDPERDTPERLKRYVQSFHPRLVGLTGTPARDRQPCSRPTACYVRKVQRSEVDRRLHDGSPVAHLRHGPGRALSHATSRLPPVRMPWPQSLAKLL